MSPPRVKWMFAFLTLVLSLAALPTSADGLNAITYDPLDDVIDIDTNETVEQPGIDIINVRILDLSGDLEVSMLVNGSVNQDASFTVNLLADGEDLFTFIMSSGTFDASDPDGLPVTVLGWTDEGRVIWEVATDLLDIQTGLEIDSAYTTYTTPGSAVHSDSLDDGTTSNDPPTVAITWPTDGLQVNGTIDVAGTATDDTAVVGVVVRVDGGEWSQAAGTDAWTFGIDTTNLSDGEHLVEVRSYDVELQSAIVNVTIDVTNGGTNDPPSVTITFPVGATPLDGTVDIAGTASDDTAVVRVDVRIDGGTWQTAVGTTSWTLTLDTTTLTDGQHTVEVLAFDEGELRSPTVTGDLYVANDPPPENDPPVVTISSPEDGEVVSRVPLTMTPVVGTWSDDTATELVVHYRLNGGDWLLADSDASIWDVNIDFRTLEIDVTHTLEVIGFDGVHNSSIAMVGFRVPPNHRPTISGNLDGMRAADDPLNPFFYGTVQDIDSEDVYVEVSTDGETWVVVGNYKDPDVPAGWSYTFNCSKKPEGRNLFFVRAFDGNIYSETLEIAYNRPDKKGGVNPKPLPGPDMAMGLLALSLVAIFAATRREGTGRG